MTNRVPNASSSAGAGHAGSPGFCRLGVAAAAVALALGSAAWAVQVPAGFQALAITPVLDEPVAMAFAPDGRLFVAEKRGVVKVIQNNAVVSTFIDLSEEVNGQWDRGMLGLAVDPNFAVNRRVYLLYVVDPVYGEPDEDSSVSTFSRLTRYQGTAASGGNVADASSRTVLIGVTPSEGMPQCWRSHSVGTVRFGADGSLLLTHGESALYGPVDSGGGYPACFQIFPASYNIGAFRSQLLDVMNGKVMRVDPNTGAGLPGNPYFDAANPSSPRSRVWASGLRNPYRFARRPGTGSANHPGTLYIGDVGWNTWEEINVSSGGENFGWPCREGFSVTSGYSTVDLADWDCATLETPSNPGPLRGPIISYHHLNAMQSLPAGISGTCVTAGVFHVGNNYPSPYRGGFFFADVVHGWIGVARVNAANELLGAHGFATSAAGPVDFAIDPVTGEVCYLSHYDGRAYRFRSLIGPGDVDRNGVVNVDDLIAVILSWGPCANPTKCPADLNVSGQVDVDDLIEVILNWG